MMETESGNQQAAGINKSVASLVLPLIATISRFRQLPSLLLSLSPPPPPRKTARVIIGQRPGHLNRISNIENNLDNRLPICYLADL